MSARTIVAALVGRLAGRRSAAWAVRLTAAAVAGLLVLAACYLPTRFQADVTYNVNGDWSLTFDGTLAYGGLIPGLMPDNPTPAQLAERVKSVTNDMMRDPGFTSVQYLNNGQYQVAYARTGNIYTQTGITFLRTDSRILQISYIKTSNQIWIRGTTVPTAQRKWITDAGLTMQGDVRITTAAPVLEHNATSTRSAANGATTYIWAIRGVDAPGAKLIIQGR